MPKTGAFQPLSNIYKTTYTDGGFIFPNWHKTDFGKTMEVYKLFTANNLSFDEPTLNAIDQLLNEKNIASAKSFEEAIYYAIMEFKRKEFQTSFNNKLEEP